MGESAFANSSGYSVTLTLAGFHTLRVLSMIHPVQGITYIALNNAMPSSVAWIRSPVLPMRQEMDGNGLVI